jgi:hypothetical protein
VASAARIWMRLLLEAARAWSSVALVGSRAVTKTVAEGFWETCG